MTSSATFERGPGTLRVHRALHAENRARAVREMRSRGHVEGALALAGGKQRRRDATDNEPLLRQESYFHWAFGVEEGDCAGAIDLATGEATLFIPRLPEEYAIWMGTIESAESFGERYVCERVMYTDEFEDFLKRQKRVYALHGTNTDSGDATSGLGSSLSAAVGDKLDTSDALFNALTELRT